MFAADYNPCWINNPISDFMQWRWASYSYLHFSLSMIKEASADGKTTWLRICSRSIQKSGLKLANCSNWHRLAQQSESGSKLNAWRGLDVTCCICVDVVETVGIDKCYFRIAKMFKSWDKLNEIRGARFLKNNEAWQQNFKPASHQFYKD